MKYRKEEIKWALKTALEKQGMSLESFEAALQSKNAEEIIKHAGPEKGGTGMFGILSGLATAAGGATIAAGAAGGMGLYKLMDSVYKTDEGVEAKKDEKKKISDANKRLQHLLKRPLQ